MFSSCFLKNFAKLVRNNDFGAVGGKKKAEALLRHELNAVFRHEVLFHAEWEGMSRNLFETLMLID